MAKSWRERRDAARKSKFFALAPVPHWDRTVRDEFCAYWEKIHPDPMTRPSDESEQFIETRRAFYAGVFIMLQKMRSVAEPAVGEDAGTAHVEAVAREVDEFYAMIKRVVEGDK